MASSDTEIANMALSHLGVGKEIATLESDAGQEAAALRRFYLPALRSTLRDFPWPFATKFLALGLVEEAPTSEWAYSYRYPSDCLRFRRILSGSRTDTALTRVPYKMGRDASGQIIYTDRTEAEAEYTVYVSDPTAFPEDFTLALSYRLAALSAIRLTAGDPFKLGQQAMQNYLFEISRAESTALNEEQADLHPDSEFIRARE